MGNNPADKVYKLLLTIPAGKVVTYGQIANKLGLPTPRMVGRILHNNPEPFDIPCHRVVFSDGSLAPSYAFGGKEKQKELLVKEGVIFNSSKVDFKKSGYSFS